MLRNNKGFSLPEIVMTGAIMITIGMGSMYMFSNMNKNMSMNRQILDRDSLLKLIIKKASDPGNIAASIANNTGTGNTLQACQTGQNSDAGADDCTALATATGATTPSPQSYDVTLWTDSVTKFTGTQASPVYYNTSGQICASSSGPNCVFKVYSKFHPICPPFSAGGTGQTCKRANSLEITVTVETTRMLASTKMAMGAKSMTTAPITGDEIASYTNRQCPSGMVLDKINQDGTLSCRNATYDCPTGQVLQSVDADGTKHCGFPQNTNQNCSAPGTTLSAVVYQDGSLGPSVCSRTIGGPDPAYPDSKGCPWGMRVGGFTASNQMLCYGEWGQRSCASNEVLTSVTYDATSHNPTANPDGTFDSWIIQGTCTALPNSVAPGLPARVWDCGVGKVIRKINFDTNGNITGLDCGDLSDCGAGSALRGFDASGNKICRSLGKSFGGGFTVQAVYRIDNSRMYGKQTWGGWLCNQGNWLALNDEAPWQSEDCFTDHLNDSITAISCDQWEAGNYRVYDSTSTAPWTDHRGNGVLRGSPKCLKFGGGTTNTSSYGASQAGGGNATNPPCNCPSWAPNKILLNEFTAEGCGFYNRDERNKINGGVCSGQPYLDRGKFACKVESWLCWGD